MNATDQTLMGMTETELRAALLILNGSIYPVQVHDAVTSATGAVLARTRGGTVREMP